MRPLLFLTLELLGAAGCLALLACAPPQRIYSLDPVDPRGARLPLQLAARIRFETGEELKVVPALHIEADRLHSADGKSWPLASIDSIDYRDAGGELHRLRVESPDDLLSYDELPRITEVQLRDGRRVELGSDNNWSRWAEDRLGLEISLDGLNFENLPLEQLHTIRLYDGGLMRDSLRSWKFWTVAGGAAVLVWVISTRSEDNLAVR